MTSLKTAINKFYKENYFCRIEDGNHKKDDKKKRKENNIINNNNHHKSEKSIKRNVRTDVRAFCSFLMIPSTLFFKFSVASCSITPLPA